MNDTTEIEELRERLKRVMAESRAEPQEVPCRICHGTGKMLVSGKLTQSQVAAQLGISGAAVNSFLRGHKGVSFTTGLRLMRWLDEAEQS